MWSNSVEDFADDVSRGIGELANDIATDFYVAAVNLAPVDTSNYVSNMNVSYGEIDRSYDPTLRKGRAGAMASGLDKLSGGFDGELTDIHITNSTPYGDYLEAGSSAQARNGVFTVAFLGVAMKYV